MLDPLDEGDHPRITLTGHGSECSCGEHERKGGCPHQAALRYLLTQAR